MKRYFSALIVIVFCLGVINVSVASSTVSAAVKKSLQANFQATQAEDLKGIMSTMHSKSPNRAATQAQLPALFQQYDLKYELLDYQFVSVSGEYAIVRVKQYTSKLSGPDFRNNTIDSFMIFRQENAQWKLWAQTILDVEFDQSVSEIDHLMGLDAYTGEQHFYVSQQRGMYTVQ